MSIADYTRQHLKGEQLRALLADRTEPELRAELYSLVHRRLSGTAKEFLLDSIIEIAAEEDLDKLLASFADTGMEDLCECETEGEARRENCRHDPDDKNDPGIPKY